MGDVNAPKQVQQAPCKAHPVVGTGNDDFQSTKQVYISSIMRQERPLTLNGRGAKRIERAGSKVDGPLGRYPYA
jgi:hypothetical protein